MPVAQRLLEKTTSSPRGLEEPKKGPSKGQSQSFQVNLYNKQVVVVSTKGDKMFPTTSLMRSSMQTPSLLARSRLVLLVETTPCTASLPLRLRYNQVARSFSSLVGGVSSVGSRMMAQRGGGGGMRKRRTLCWEGAVNTSRFMRRNNNAQQQQLSWRCPSSSSSNARTPSQCSSTNRTNSTNKNTSKRLLSSPAAVATTTTTRTSCGNSSVFSHFESLRRQRPFFSLNKSLLPELTTALPWIGHASYLALASGFLMTDMLQLRLLLVGGYFGLVTFHSLHPKPLRIPLRWSAVFVLVNAAAAGVLLMDRYAAPLDAADEVLYQRHFCHYLTRGQFHQLLQWGQRVELRSGHVLTRENVAGEQLYFLLDGRARIYHGGSVAATIERGGFVNDVAFQRGPHVGAYGTVVVVPLTSEDDDDDSNGTAAAAATALVWDVDTLRAELQKRPELERRMKFCWSDHLVQSLLRQREAAHLRQQQQQELKKSTAATEAAVSVVVPVETMTYSTATS